MWPYIEVVFFLGILICSGYLAQSNGIKSSSEIPSKIINENDPKSFFISDSGLATSDSRDIDAESIGYSDSVRSENSNRDIDVESIGYSDSVRSESNNRDINTESIGYSDSVRAESNNRDIDDETIGYSDSDRSESDNVESDSKTTSHSDSDRSESESVTNGHTVSNDHLSSTVRLNAISEVPMNYAENKIKDEKDFSTPQRNGRQKNNRGKHRRERLRLNQEQRDVDFFEPIRMPQTFEEYDHNRDGYISLRELVEVTGAVVNAKYAFSDSDIDNNGKIDEEEFKRAPWDLSGQVERVKHKQISSADLL